MEANDYGDRGDHLLCTISGEFCLSARLIPRLIFLPHLLWFGSFSSSQLPPTTEWFIWADWVGGGGWGRRGGFGCLVGGGGWDLCFIDGLILNDLSTTCHNLFRRGKGGGEEPLPPPPSLRIFINHTLWEHGSGLLGLLIIIWIVVTVMITSPSPPEPPSLNFNRNDLISSTESQT